VGAVGLRCWHCQQTSRHHGQQHEQFPHVRSPLLETPVAPEPEPVGTTTGQRGTTNRTRKWHPYLGLFVRPVAAPAGLEQRWQGDLTSSSSGWDDRRDPTDWIAHRAVIVRDGSTVEGMGTCVD
jgi:hypothetical protein